MKRMYVIIILFTLIGFWAVSCLGQMAYDIQTLPQDKSTTKEPFDRMKRRMELRAEMHRRMMDKLINGNGPDMDIFKDLEEEMNEAMSEAFAGPGNSFSGSLFSNSTISNFSSEWSETAKGRVLIITPKSKDQKLEIDTKPDIVTIKGKTEQTSANGTSVSSFSNSFSVPSDCDGSKVVMSQKDGKILVEFPYKSMKSVQVPRKEGERTPLPPSSNDIEI